jgi:uncharacterized protein (DUF885 family)
MNRSATSLSPLLALVCLLATAPLHAQVGQPAATHPAHPPGPGQPAASLVPDLDHLAAAPTSPMAGVVDRFIADRDALGRRHDARGSAERRDRFRAFYSEWRDRLAAMDFAALDVEGRIDWVLLDAEAQYQLGELERERELFGEIRPLAPFIPDLIALHEARRRHEPVEPRAVADLLSAIPGRIDDARRATERALDAGADAPSPVIGLRAAEAVAATRRTLRAWHDHHAGYDPGFTWWVSEPHERADQALDRYARFLRERVVGDREGADAPIIGDPIGEDGLRADLDREMIPYSAAELIAIAEEQLAWGEAEMRRAARELGFGDDWKAALEHVKGLHVPPGEQPGLVLELHRQSMEFLRERDLVTIPPLAEEIWRLEMLSPEAQRTAPFFLGGEVVRVAFPTDGMEHDDKLMSLRGNNEHFSRAVVHHELIPGHHLQGFMAARYNTHRRVFSTPFWHEGNALYWEMRLWDLGFPRGPEDRIGMLFWRNHRAARIIFSLSFHLERMTPEEAIDFLVERVGHERANAEAEVRRSFLGTYSPLYQAAYMLGGLQFMALHRELVESGRMTERQFHDAILQGGRMPVEMVRARLTGQFLERDHQPAWRFADP